MRKSIVLLAMKLYQLTVIRYSGFGFMPAFKNLKDDEIHLSTDAHGELSVMHLFDGLPNHWINEQDSQGKALTLQAEVVAGFMRNARFYTLSELMHSICDS